MDTSDRESHARLPTIYHQRAGLAKASAEWPSAATNITSGVAWNNGQDAQDVARYNRIAGGGAIAIPAGQAAAVGALKQKTSDWCVAANLLDPQSVSHASL